MLNLHLSSKANRIQTAENCSRHGQVISAGPLCLHPRSGSSSALVLQGSWDSWVRWAGFSSLKHILAIISAGSLCAKSLETEWHPVEWCSRACYQALLSMGAGKTGARIPLQLFLELFYGVFVATTSSGPALFSFCDKSTNISSIPNIYRSGLFIIHWKCFLTLP